MVSEGTTLLTTTDVHPLYVTSNCDPSAESLRQNYQALANVSFDLGLLPEPRSAKHISKCLNPSSFSKAVKQCLTIMVPLCLCALLNQGPNVEMLVTSLNNIFMNPFRNESNVTGSGINPGINTFLILLFYLHSLKQQGP